MNPAPTCDEETRRANAERYVSHRLTKQEAEAFEEHFLTCPQCQAEVRFASAVAGSLPREPLPVSRSPARRSRLLWGVGLAVAAGMAALLITNRDDAGRIVALGAVTEPPAYLGIPLRGEAVPGEALFDAAMASYAQRRYGDAATGLRDALSAGADSVPAQFFLASSLLMDDEPLQAAEIYQSVIDRGDTPYRAEARYYRAKALLRLDRAADAQSELAQLTADDGITYQMGQGLADSIAFVRGR